jgi:hypothetical protein
MVSVQKIWQHNQFQKGISFGFDETIKEEVPSTEWLIRHERKRMIKTLKSDIFMVIFTSYRA